jgi:hypothetical protein
VVALLNPRACDQHEDPRPVSVRAFPQI